MAKLAMTKGSKVLIAVIVIGLVVFFGYKFIKPEDINALKSGKIAPEKVTKLGDVGGSISVGLLPYTGYSGVILFNNGSEPNDESRYKKDFDLDVTLTVDFDYNSLRSAFKSDQIQVLVMTNDMMPCEFSKGSDLITVDTKAIFQNSKSRGADVIIARRGISSFEQLRGKKVACAKLMPSESLLLWGLKASDMTIRDIDFIETATPDDAGALLKAQEVDAAVVWAPQDKELLKLVEGSKLLLSTKDAPSIINDMIVVKKSFIQDHKDQLVALVTGWLIANAELNENTNNCRITSIPLVAKSLNFPEDFVDYSKVRFSTFSDNLDAFGINTDYDGTTGDMVYTQMASIYSEQHPVDVVKPLSWGQVKDLTILNAIDLPKNGNQSSEEVVRYSEPKPEILTKTALTTKKITINFATGSATLSEDDKYNISKNFMPFVKQSNFRVRIEGNTDNTGNYSNNIRLSNDRANSVRDYLISEGCDPNRIVCKGNGPDKPIADNTTVDGREKNRRTDFELVSD